MDYKTQTPLNVMSELLTPINIETPISITTPTNVPIKLIISSSTEAMSYLITTGSSYLLSTSKITGSVSGLDFSDIKSVKVEPSGSSGSIEYYIATT